MRVRVLNQRCTLGKVGATVDVLDVGDERIEESEDWPRVNVRALRRCGAVELVKAPTKKAAKKSATKKAQG